MTIRLLLVRSPISPIAALTLGVLWLCADQALLGGFSSFGAGDNSEIIAPSLLRYRFAESIWPLWDNLTVAGSDRDSLGSVPYLDVFLYRYFPGWLAISIRVGSQVLVSAGAAYMLARRTFAFTPWTAVFCGLSYAVLIDPGMLINATFAYFPLLILAVTLVLENRSQLWRWVLLGTAIAMISGTGYFSRLLPFTPLAIIAWFLFVDFRRRAADWAIIAASAAMLPLLSLETIWALKTQAPLSHLPLVRYQPSLDDSIRDVLTHPWFVGSPVLITFSALFLFAVATLRGIRGRLLTLLALFVLGTLGPIAAVWAQTTIFSSLEFLHGFDFKRLLQIMILLMPFAAGYGFESLASHLREADRRRQYLWRGAVIVAVGVVAFWSLKDKMRSAREWVESGTYVHNFNSPVLSDLAARMKQEPLPVRAEAYQMFSTMMNAYGIETAGGYQPLYSMRYYEYWQRVMEPWASSLAPQSHEMWGGHAKKLAVAAGRPREWRGDRLMLLPHDHASERRLADLYRLNMLSLANVGYIVSRDRLIDGQLEPIREAPKPWSSLATWEKFKVNVRANFFGREHLYIYRNREVLPRFFSVSGLQIFPDAAAVLAAVAAAPERNLRDKAYVAATSLPAGLTEGGAFNSLAIRLERYENDIIALRVEGGPGFLVVTNSYSPYWHCALSGRPLVLIPVYHAFWGVHIEGSDGAVVCRYQPPALFGYLARLFESEDIR